MVNNS